MRHLVALTTSKPPFSFTNFGSGRTLDAVRAFTPITTQTIKCGDGPDQHLLSLGFDDFTTPNQPQVPSYNAFGPASFSRDSALHESFENWVFDHGYNDESLLDFFEVQHNDTLTPIIEYQHSISRQDTILGNVHESFTGYHHGLGYPYNIEGQLSSWHGLSTPD